MWRLRTTVGLSVLALAVGVAGTAWLSALTGDWKGPARVAVPLARVHAALRQAGRAVHRHAAPVRQSAATTMAPPAGNEPALTPIDMPALPASLLERQPLGNGKVVLRLVVDGGGRVQSAAVARSSGDAALDDRAVRTALRWRFAVPADRPQGLAGELVMRFDDTPAAPLL